MSQTTPRATERWVRRWALALAVCSFAAGCGDREAAHSAPVETAVLDRASLPEAPPFVAAAVSFASLSPDESITPLGVPEDSVGGLESGAAWTDEPATVRRLPPTERIAYAATAVPVVAENEASPVEAVGPQPPIVADGSLYAEHLGAESYEPTRGLPGTSTAEVPPHASAAGRPSAILITGPDGNPLGPGDQRSRQVSAPPSVSAGPTVHVVPPAPMIIERRLPPVSSAVEARDVPAAVAEGDPYATESQDQRASGLPSHLPDVGPGPPTADTPRGADAIGVSPEPQRLPARPATAEEPPRPVGGLLLHATQARHHVQQGFGAANRGMLYTARQEFLRVLKIVAEAKDARTGRRSHMDALAAGLTALEEAEDIRRVSSSVAEANLAMWVATHTTPVLKDADVSTMVPLAIIDRYHAYAQQQLGAAVAGDPSGSMALYGLARIYEYLGSENGADRVARARQSAALHEAALLAHPENHLAAHELGVVLTKLGLFEKAIAMLTRSVRLHPSSTAYHNLAVASRRFGRHQQAATAERYAAQMAALERSTGASSSRVAWLEPEAFSRTAERTAALPADSSHGPQRGPMPQDAVVGKEAESEESSDWWKLPIWK